MAGQPLLAISTFKRAPNRGQWPNLAFIDPLMRNRGWPATFALEWRIGRKIMLLQRLRQFIVHDGNAPGFPIITRQLFR